MPNKQHPTSNQRGFDTNMTRNLLALLETQEIDQGGSRSNTNHETASSLQARNDTSKTLSQQNEQDGRNFSTFLMKFSFSLRRTIVTSKLTIWNRHSWRLHATRIYIQIRRMENGSNVMIMHILFDCIGLSILQLPHHTNGAHPLHQAIHFDYFYKWRS